jgi:hypothetical protein
MMTEIAFVGLIVTGFAVLAGALVRLGIRISRGDR